jgi:hypothetical protein
MGTAVSGEIAVNWMNHASAADAGGPIAPVDLTGPVPRAICHERRRQPRRSGIAEHGIHSARVRPGIDARVLDVSVEGALIETAGRLHPGRRLILQLKFATCAVAVRGVVLRCTVFHASVDRIAYRGALVFERRLHWVVDANGVTGGAVD